MRKIDLPLRVKLEDEHNKERPNATNENQSPEPDLTQIQHTNVSSQQLGVVVNSGWGEGGQKRDSKEGTVQRGQQQWTPSTAKGERTLARKWMPQFISGFGQEFILSNSLGHKIHAQEMVYMGSRHNTEVKVLS